MTDDKRLTDVLMRPAPRYTANEEILRIERELQEDGAQLDNPARPIKDRNGLIHE